MKQDCVLAPIFNTFMDLMLDRFVSQGRCGACAGNNRSHALFLPNDAVFLAESVEVTVMTVEALHEMTKLLWSTFVPWIKTKTQVFGGLLDEAVHLCGENKIFFLIQSLW